MTETGDFVRLIAYTGLLISCLAASRAAGTGSNERRVWLLIGLGGMALGCAEVLDLGHVVADAGRRVAGEGGWYGSRRPLQAAVILAVISASVAGALALTRAMRGYQRATRLGAMLAFGLAGFVVIRGISLHQVDAWMNAYPGRANVTLGETLETWWLLALIAVAARSAAISRFRGAGPRR